MAAEIIWPHNAFNYVAAASETGGGGRKTKWIKGYMRTSESAINFLLSAAAVKLEVGRSTTRQSNSGD